MEGRIGKYQLQGEIGRGSFGRVFRAYDPSIGRPVAIKILTADGDSELTARFRAEVATTGQLQHKNIVTVFDCGEHEGSPYIVMELLEGDNLQTVLQSKRTLGLLERMRVMHQVAEGLYYAHQKGVIHRDVKPANILLLPNGMVKIMDFGIARLSNLGTSRRTRQGDLIGTTSYMAPERFGGVEANVRTDIFALGVVYYELLSGVHPFQTRDVSATIFRIVSVEPVQLREVLPGCPAALGSLVHRAMAKDPERRYASLDDLLIDAEPILLDLRRAQAGQLMIEVTRMIAQGDLDGAHSKLKEALELDPSSRDVRDARQTLETERKRRLLEENIQALEREAAAKAANRQFPEALQTLESALRLEPDNARLKQLIENSRAVMLASREASRLLSEAKREAQYERYDRARTLALQALTADPEHPEAPPLIREAENELARLERVRRFQMEIGESERLLAAGHCEAARSKLQTLENTFPGSLEIRELHSCLLRRQTEQVRRQRLARLESEIAKVRRMKEEGRLSEASEALEPLVPEFPGVAAIDTLRACLHEEMNACTRAAALTVLLDDARHLIGAGRAPEAAMSLERGLKTFPGDAGLERLLQAATMLSQEISGRQSVSDIVADVRQLRQAGRLDDALEAVQSGLRTTGRHTVLSDLSKVLLSDLEDRRSNERLQASLTSAAGLLESGSTAQALSVLRKAQTQYPADPSVELLFARAEEQYALDCEHDTISAVLRTANDKAAQGDLAGAIEEIAQLSIRFPRSKQLAQTAAEFRVRLRSSLREKRIEALLLEVQNLVAAQNWSQAMTKLEAAQSEFPGQVEFDELAVRIRTKQQNAEVEKAVEGVRKHLKNGHLERAAIALAKIEPVYGKDEVWKVEKRNLDRQVSYQNRLREVEEQRKNGKYEQAESLLRQLLSEHPEDSRAVALLKMVRADLAPLNPKKAAENRGQGELAATKVFTAHGDQLVQGNRADAGVWPGLQDVSPTKPRPEKEQHEWIICRHCQAGLPAGARFCDFCGKPVSRFAK